MNHVKFILSGLVLMSTICILKAQNQSININVVDKTTLKKLSNVDLYILNINDDTLIFNDEIQGNFSIPLSVGSYNIRIEHHLYQEEVDTIIFVKKGDEIALFYEFTLLSELISIVSKEKERPFEAILSSSVITKEDIVASGATTIEEVLRLVPGFIVRQITNGNYDVHIRGNDNMPPNNLTLYSANTLSLIMVDNRIVYSYLNGGVFWETLSIGVDDIEQIEVIRGPASALYGPNAVTGVINIITRKPEKEGLYANFNAQYGNSAEQVADNTFYFGGNSIISHGSIGFQDGNFKGRVSLNYEDRGRFDEEYYNFRTASYKPVDSLEFALTGGNIPSENFSPILKSKNNNWNSNLSLSWSNNNTLSTELLAGYQKSDIQTVYFENTATPLIRRISELGFVNFKADIFGVNISSSYTSGVQDLYPVTNRVKYDARIFQSIVDYQFETENFKLRPGVDFQWVSYDDTKYIDPDLPRGFLNSKEKLYTIAPSLMSEYKFTTKSEDEFYLVSAYRLDNYFKPEKNYHSFQLAAKYLSKQNSLTRIVYSRANRGPFFAETYGNLDDVSPAGFAFRYSGSDTLNLPVMDMFEIGFRNKLSKSMFIDFEFFTNKTRDFTVVQQEPENSYIDTSSGLFIIPVPFRNLDLVAQQIGATVEIGGKFEIISEQQSQISKSYLNFKVFGTLQSTTLDDYRVDTSLVFLKHDWTPSLFGGAFIQYNSKSWNISLSWYGYTNQVYTHIIGGSDNIEADNIFNCRIAYKVLKTQSDIKDNNLEVYANIKNILSGSRQFGFSDTTRVLALFGIRYNFY